MCERWNEVHTLECCECYRIPRPKECDENLCVRKPADIPNANAMHMRITTTVKTQDITQRLWHKIESTKWKMKNGKEKKTLECRGTRCWNKACHTNTDDNNPPTTLHLRSHNKSTHFLPPSFWACNAHVASIHSSFIVVVAVKCSKFLVRAVKLFIEPKTYLFIVFASEKKMSTKLCLAPHRYAADSAVS